MRQMRKKNWTEGNTTMFVRLWRKHGAYTGGHYTHKNDDGMGRRRAEGRETHQIRGTCGGNGAVLGGGPEETSGAEASKHGR